MSKLIPKHQKPSGSIIAPIVDLNNSSKQTAQWMLNRLSKLTHNINKGLFFGSHTDYGQTSPFVNVDRNKVREGQEKSIKLTDLLMQNVAPFVSPSNYLVSIFNGNIDPRVGLRIISSADPRLLLLAIGTDLYGLNKGYNIIKNTTPYIKAIADPYTTKNSFLGYYGNNLLNRTYGTLSRRFNLLDVSRSPELLRKMENFPIVLNGKVILTSTRQDWKRTNFTTDRPVVSHQHVAPWDHRDLYIVNPNKIDWSKAASIEPSDTFFPDYDISLNPVDVTVVSGNPNILNRAKSIGMPTLSSDRLRLLYSLMNDINNRAILSNRNKLMFKDGFLNTVPSDIRLNYQKELLNLLTLRGVPKYKDYKMLENKTGLLAGVIPLTDNILLNISNPNIETFDFPNQSLSKGPQEKRALNFNRKYRLISRQPYNNVFYDPASPVEYYYKQNNVK